jgi:hypothetical protein
MTNIPKKEIFMCIKFNFHKVHDREKFNKTLTLFYIYSISILMYILFLMLF